MNNYFNFLKRFFFIKQQTFCSKLLLVFVCLISINSCKKQLGDEAFENESFGFKLRVYSGNNQVVSKGVIASNDLTVLMYTDDGSIIPEMDIVFREVNCPGETRKLYPFIPIPVAETNSSGIASVKIFGPEGDNVSGKKFCIEAFMPDSKVSTRFELEVDAYDEAEILNYDGTTPLIVTAGEPITYKLKVTDKDGNINEDFNSCLDLKWVFTTEKSWGNKTAVIPGNSLSNYYTGVQSCCFVNGKCELNKNELGNDLILTQASKDKVGNRILKSGNVFDESQTYLSTDFNEENMTITRFFVQSLNPPAPGKNPLTPISNFPVVVKKGPANSAFIARKISGVDSMDPSLDLDEKYESLINTSSSVSIGIDDAQSITPKIIDGVETKHDTETSTFNLEYEMVEDPLEYYSIEVDKGGNLLNLSSSGNLNEWKWSREDDSSDTFDYASYYDSINGFGLEVKNSDASIESVNSGFLVNSTGNTFNLVPKKAGKTKLTLIKKDSTGKILSETSTNFIINFGTPSKIILKPKSMALDSTDNIIYNSVITYDSSDSQYTVQAGKRFELEAQILDRYDNLSLNATGLFQLSMWVENGYFHDTSNSDNELGKTVSGGNPSLSLYSGASVRFLGTSRDTGEILKSDSSGQTDFVPFLFGKSLPGSLVANLKDVRQIDPTKFPKYYIETKASVTNDLTGNPTPILSGESEEIKVVLSEPKTINIHTKVSSETNNYESLGYYACLNGTLSAYNYSSFTTAHADNRLNSVCNPYFEFGQGNNRAYYDTKVVEDTRGLQYEAGDDDLILYAFYEDFGGNVLGPAKVKWEGRAGFYGGIFPYDNNDLTSLLSSFTKDQYDNPTESFYKIKLQPSEIGLGSLLLTQTESKSADKNYLPDIDNGEAPIKSTPYGWSDAGQVYRYDISATSNSGSYPGNTVDATKTFRINITARDIDGNIAPAVNGDVTLRFLAKPCPVTTCTDGAEIKSPQNSNKGNSPVFFTDIYSGSYQEVKLRFSRGEFKEMSPGQSFNIQNLKLPNSSDSGKILISLIDPNATAVDGSGNTIDVVSNDLAINIVAGSVDSIKLADGPVEQNPNFFLDKDDPDLPSPDHRYEFKADIEAKSLYLHTFDEEGNYIGYGTSGSIIWNDVNNKPEINDWSGQMNYAGTGPLTRITDYTSETGGINPVSYKFRRVGEGTFYAKQHDKEIFVPIKIVHGDMAGFKIDVKLPDGESFINVNTEEFLEVGQDFQLEVSYIDRFQNIVSSVNGTKQIDFDINTRGTTRKGYSYYTQSNPSSWDWNFSNGVFTTPILRIYKAQESDAEIDQPYIKVTDINPEVNVWGGLQETLYQKMVSKELYRFYLVKSDTTGLVSGKLVAGNSTIYSVRAEDLYGNLVRHRTGNDQKVKVSFVNKHNNGNGSGLGGQDILSTTLINPSPSSFAGVDNLDGSSNAEEEVTGNITSGIGLLEVSAKKVGTLNLKAEALDSTNSVLPDIAYETSTTEVIAKDVIEGISWGDGTNNFKPITPEEAHVGGAGNYWPVFKVYIHDEYYNLINNPNFNGIAKIVKVSGTKDIYRGEDLTDIEMSFDSTGVATFSDVYYLLAEDIQIKAQAIVGGTVIKESSVYDISIVPNNAINLVVKLPHERHEEGVKTLSEAIVPIDPSIPNLELTAGVQSDKVEVFLVDEAYNHYDLDTFDMSGLFSKTLMIGDQLNTYQNIATIGSSTYVNGKLEFKITDTIASTDHKFKVCKSAGVCQDSSSYSVIPNSKSKLSVLINSSLNKPNPGSTDFNVAATDETLIQKAGTSYNVKVYATDDYFNVIDSDSSTQVSLGIANDSMADTNGTKILSNGIAEFTILSKKVGNDKSFTINDLAGAGSNYATKIPSHTFEVTPGDAARVIALLPGQTHTNGVDLNYPGQTLDNVISNYSNYTDTQVACTNFDIELKTVDTYFNVVTNDTTSRTITLTTSDPSTSREYIDTIPASGTKTLSVNAIKRTTAGNLHTLSLSSDLATNYVTSNYSINPNDASNLVVVMPGQVFNPGDEEANLSTSIIDSSSLTTQVAGNSYNPFIYLTDSCYNIIRTSDNASLANESVTLASSNDSYFSVSSGTQLVNGVANPTVTNFVARSDHRISASIVGRSYTSKSHSDYNVTPNSVSRVQALLPGMSMTPGSNNVNIAVTGTPNDAIAGENYQLSFYAIDNWHNVVTSVGSGNTITFETSGDNNDQSGNPDQNKYYKVFDSGLAQMNIQNIQAGDTNVVNYQSDLSGIAADNSINYKIVSNTASKTIVKLPWYDFDNSRSNWASNSLVSNGGSTSYTTDEDLNIIVYATDDYYNIVETYNDSFNISTSDPNDTNDGSFSFVSGIKDITLNTVTASSHLPVGTDHKIEVTSSLSSNVDSENYTIENGSVNKLIVLLPGQDLLYGKPSDSTSFKSSITHTSTAGSVEQFRVVATDSEFNLVDDYNDSSITVFSSDSANVTIANNASTPNSMQNGIAIFDVTDFKVSSNSNSINITDTSLSEVNSETYSVTHNTHTKTLSLFDDQIISAGKTPSISNQSLKTFSADDDINVKVVAVDEWYNTITNLNSGLINITSTEPNDNESTGLYSGTFSSGVIDNLKVDSITSNSVGTFYNFTNSGTGAIVSSNYKIDPGNTHSVFILMPGQTFNPDLRSSGNSGSDLIVNSSGSIDQVAGSPFSVELIYTDSNFNIINSNVSGGSLQVNGENASNVNTYSADVTNSTGRVTKSVTAYTATADGVTKDHFLSVEGVSFTNYFKDNFKVDPNTATKSIIILPGQNLNSGLQDNSNYTAAISGDQNVNLIVGDSNSIKLYALDDWFNIVKSYSSSSNLNNSGDELSTITSSPTNFTNGLSDFTFESRKSNLSGNTSNILVGNTDLDDLNSLEYTVVAGSAFKEVVALPGQTLNFGIKNPAVINSPDSNLNTDDSFDVTIYSVDEYNNVNQSSTPTVTLVTNSDTQDQAEYSTTLSSGSATVSISPVQASASQTIGLTSSSNNTYTSSNYDILPGAVKKVLFTFDGQTINYGMPSNTPINNVISGNNPSDIIAGSSINIKASLLDNEFNLVNTLSSTQNITFNPSNNKDPLIGPKTFSTGGISNFSISHYVAENGKTISGDNNSYTYHIKDGGFNVDNASLSKAILLHPGQSLTAGNHTDTDAISNYSNTFSYNSGNPINFKLVATDAYYNVVDSNTDNFTINASSLFDQDSYTSNFVSGEKQVNVTPVKVSSSNQSLVSNISSITNVSSSNFTINPGSSANLVFLYNGQSLSEGIRNSDIDSAITQSMPTLTAGVPHNVSVFTTDQYFNKTSDNISNIIISFDGENALNSNNKVTFNVSSGSSSIAITNFTKTSTGHNINIESGTNLVKKLKSNYSVDSAVASKTIVLLPNQSLVGGLMDPTNPSNAILDVSPVSITAGSNYDVTIKSVDNYLNEADSSIAVNLDLSNDVGATIVSNPSSFNSGSATFTVKSKKSASNISMVAVSDLDDKSSKNYSVNPGSASKMVMLLPNQSLVGGVDSLASAVTGTPTTQEVGVAFDLTLKIVDIHFNEVNASTNYTLSHVVSTESTNTITGNMNASSKVISVTNQSHDTSHQFKIISNDLSQSSNLFSSTYQSLDTINPSVSIDNITSSVQGGSTININYTANDTGSGFDTLKLKLTEDDTIFVEIADLSPSSSSYSYTVNSIDTTTAKLEIVGVDKAGNTSSALTNVFTIDSTAPVFSVITPVDNEDVQSSVTVAGDSCEPGIDVIITGDIQSSPVSASCNAGGLSGTYSVSVNLTSGDGSKTLNISQTDSVGNQTTITRVLSSDTTSPILSITSPADNSYVLDTFSMSGNCESGLDVTISGSGIESDIITTCSGGSFSTSSINLTDNDESKSLTITQTDASGNQTQLSKNYIKDTVGPNLTFSAPTPSQLTQESVDISGNCEGNLNINVSGDITSPTSFNCNSSSFSSVAVTLSGGDGAKTITLEQTDSAGNQTSTSISVTKDTTPPSVPSSLTLSTPSRSPSLNPNPTLTVSGINSGDVIKVFSDDSCSSELGSATSTGNSVDVSISSSLSENTNYTFYAKALDAAGNSSNCSSANLSYRYGCPVGYARVQSNTTLGTVNDFCVMKYEAKAWDDSSGNSDSNIDSNELASNGEISSGSLTSYLPVSNENGDPWRSITITNAKARCEALGSGYTLISNPEWMTIARNIEGESSNWTSESVGSNECVKSGNIGSIVTCNGGNASYDGSDPEFGNSRNSLNALNLSNSEVIYDFSGNVWEWVDWNSNTLLKELTQGERATSSTADNNSFIELSSLDTLTSNSDEMKETSWQPSNSAFGSSNLLGKYHSYTSDNESKAAMRGGSWNSMNNAGIYSLSFEFTSSETSSSTGFRCVYRPN